MASAQPLGWQLAIFAEDAHKFRHFLCADFRLFTREHFAVAVIDVVFGQPQGLAEAARVTAPNSLHDGEPLVVRHAEDL